MNDNDQLSSRILFWAMLLSVLPVIHLNALLIMVPGFLFEMPVHGITAIIMGMMHVIYWGTMARYVKWAGFS